MEASANEQDGSQLMATVAYVAPELVTDGHADARTDVYSAGIVLFEMLTGRVPYDGDRPVDIAWQHVDRDVPAPSTLVPGLPRVLDDLVAQCVAGGPMLLGPAADVGVDHTYVRDLGGAVAALLRAEKLPHDTYNVSGGRLVTGVAIARTLERLRPGVRTERVPRDPGLTFPYPRPPFAIARIEADVGWTPTLHQKIDSAVRADREVARGAGAGRLR